MGEQPRGRCGGSCRITGNRSIPERMKNHLLKRGLTTQNLCIEKVTTKTKTYKLSHKTKTKVPPAISIQIRNTKLMNHFTISICCIHCGRLQHIAHRRLVGTAIDLRSSNFRRMNIAQFCFLSVQMNRSSRRLVW